MATFEEILKRTNAMAQRLSEETSVPFNDCMSVIQYARCLPLPHQPEIIDNLMFCAQMGLRFGITSRYHIELMYEAVRDPRLGKINLEDYAKTICTFISSDLECKIKFVFSVYNFNRTGLIEVRDMASMLKNCIVPSGDEDANEQFKELIEMVVSSLDTNMDGVVSKDEFREFVLRNVLSMELFGKVLPCEEILQSFKALISNKSPAQIKELFQAERTMALHEPPTTKKFSKLYPGIFLDMP